MGVITIDDLTPAKTPAESNLEILVRECREFVEYLGGEGLLAPIPNERKNALVLGHLTTDLSDYGIPVWEWFDISEEDAKGVITRTLALPEYNEDPE